MKSKKKSVIGAADVVLTALALILFVGLVTFLKPCGPKEDGSWMTCHWAGHALSGIAGAILVMAVIRLFVPRGVKLGLDIGVAVLGVLALCVPGHLIATCMMDTMRCRTVMTPGVTVLSVLLAGTAAVDIFLRRKGDRA